jgi:hypothetical protein
VTVPDEPSAASTVDGRLVVRLSSRRDPAILYEIRALRDGSLTCSCPGFAFSRRKRCRHVDIVLVARAIAPMLSS